MRKKMKDYLAAIYSPAVEPKLAKLLDQKLISDKDAETIRKSDDAAKKKTVIRPTQWMYWNVHVDGLEYTHDLIVEREGVFKECVEAIKMAKILGFQVATNTTVYRETEVAEIEEMFKFLSSLEVDGHTISPGYDYDAAKKDMVKRLGRNPKEFFLTRDMTRAEICEDPGMGQGVHDFRHAGVSGISRRQTRADLHRVGDPDLQRQGLESAVLPDDRRPLRRLSGNAVEGAVGKIRRRERRGARPALRKLHGPLRLRSQRRARHELPVRRQLEEFQIQLRREAQAVSASPELVKRAFNGVTIGKGHLAEAKAAINSPAAGARGAFARKEDGAQRTSAPAMRHERDDCRPK